MDREKIYTAYKPRAIAKKIGVIAIFVVIAFMAAVALGIYTDYLETKEIGEQFVDVFFTNLTMKLILSFVYFAFSFVLVFLFTLLIRKNLRNSGAETKFLEYKTTVLIVSAFIAFVASGYMGGNLFEKFLMFKNSIEFNLSDPILGLDVGYYIFERPFIKMLIDGISGTLMFTIIYCAILYFFLFIKIGERTVGDLLKNKAIMMHISVLLIIYMLLKSFGVLVNSQEILTDKFINLVGAGFVDVNILLKYYQFVPYISIVIMIVALFFLIRKKFISAIVTCFSYLVIFLIVNLIGWGVQGLYVSPNEVVAEAEYIKNNIQFTRYGYNLHESTEFEYNVSDESSLAREDLSDEIVDNIRIIDFPATVTATNQLQGIRGYYYFNDMDVGVYNINGRKEAVAIGAREIFKKNLEDSAKNYLNERFRFTHGFGVAMAKINDVTSKGQPEYLISNLVPEKTDGVPEITQPRIYFGQLTDDQVIVNTKIRELDYSEGTKDIEFDYDGSAGIKLTFWNKLLFAFKTGDFRMLIASQITPESRLLINRNVVERVRKVAPFFKYDTNPVIVIDDDGTLKWVIDGYTTSSELPYSQYTDGYNYIRNSFKVVVDAYTGNVDYYIIDNSDPVVNVYSKAYPTLFSDKPIPESIITKSKYPEYLFGVQCKIYSQYHTEDSTIFYNKNDIYAIANEKYSKDIRPIEPYYNIMQLDAFNKNEPEMILMLPYTLINRENMVSWIAVGCEGENYGKIISYKFPKDYTVYGPLQIENMIDNDPEISKEMTLWDSGGSNVIRGNLLVIPVKDTILYVEPVYIASDNQASLPLLQRVIVGCGEEIVMEKTIDEALDKLFKSVPVEESQSETDVLDDKVQSDNKDIISSVVSAYNLVESASASGDWVEFGRAMDILKKAVSELETQR